MAWIKKSSPRVKSDRKELKENLVDTGNHYFTIFIRLRDLPGQLEQLNKRNWKKYTLINFFQEKYGNDIFKTKDFYHELFCNGPCLFLIDGLDEIAETHKITDDFSITRKEGIDWLLTELEVWENKNKFARFILTGRPEVKQNLRLRKAFSVYEVQDFNDDEKIIFTNYWYNEYKKKLEQNKKYLPEYENKFSRQIADIPDRKEAFTKNILTNKHLQDLLKKPLLLSLVLMSYSIDPKTFQKSIGRNL